MRISISASRRIISAIFISVFIAALFVAFGHVSAYAQTQGVTDGSTPSALTAGAPAGSYSLSGFESVNPYNGGLNFSLPLLSLGGRGGAGYTITLRIDQKWSIRKDINPGHAANYYPTPSWVKQDGIGVMDQTYSVGKLSIRQAASRDFFLVNSTCGYAQRHTLTRLTFTAPDGTEYELRDTLRNGAAHLTDSSTCQPGQYFNRGKVFVTADGSYATFIADSDVTDYPYNNPENVPPSGVMILKDGTRFRVSGGISGGVIDWMRDRNGNLVTFSYDPNTRNLTGVTDPVGRSVTISSGQGQSKVIAYKGFGGADRTVTINIAPLSVSTLRPGFQIRTQASLFPGLTLPGANSNVTPPVISSVVLPDGRSYQFFYDDYAELSRVVLPTGGAFEYDYAAGLTDGDPSGMLTDSNNERQVYRRVVERRVYTSGGTGSAYSVKQVYGRPESSNSNAGYVEVQQCTSGPSAGACGTGAVLLGRERHYYYGSPRLSFNKQPTDYSGWQEGKEYRTEAYDPLSGVLLRKVDNTWEQPVDGATWPFQPAQSETSGAARPNGPQVTQVLTTLSDTNQVVKQTYSYDQYGNRTDTYEYDYVVAGSGQAATLLRRAHTDFVTAPAYVNADVNPALGAGLRGLPSVTWVSSDAAGANKAARTSYIYDQYAPADPGVTGHDAAYGAGFMTRGNRTSATSYLNPVAPSGGITTTATYDVAGNVTSTTDARGKTSYIYYNDNFSDGNNGRGAYTFPTGTQSAVPDLTGQYGSAYALTTSTKYDFYSGLAVSSTDANGKTTSFDYTDPLDRIKSVTRPDGGTTTYVYDRSMNAGVMNDYVRTLTSLDSSRSIDSYQFFDGLGRPNRFFLNEGGSPAVLITGDTQYDPVGRAYRVSNPYRTNGSGDAVNPSNRWTTTACDALGRVTKVTMPDGARVHTAYSGTQVLVTDQANRQRVSMSDAHGRLTNVWEVKAADPQNPDSGLETVSFPTPADVPAVSTGYRTSYTYDVMGNLRKVNQGGQVRFFMYDSFSRLIRAKNPEQAAGSVVSNMTDSVTDNSQWSLAYGYDDNGNLTARVDARGVTTNYTYDGLNRNTLITYTRPTVTDVASTPDVKRYYDNAASGANGLGRLYYSEVVGISSSLFDSYDAAGRPLRYHQVFGVGGAWGQPFYVTRSYDKAGHVTSQTYPSGRNISYSYDAAGRMSSFAGNLGDGVQRTYSTGVTYDEFGGIRQEQFGTQTPLYNKLHYNVRGQLYDVRLSSVSWAADQWNWNHGALLNYYSAAELTAATNAARSLSGSDNNGNLRRAGTYVPLEAAGVYTEGNTASYAYYQDDYDYDSLNRLNSVTETVGASGVAPATAFKQAYDYDRFGNRTINAAATQVYGQNPTYTIPEPQFTVVAANNRLAVPAGVTGRMDYDAAGNLVNDTYTSYGRTDGSPTRIYDAENRLTAAKDGNLATVSAYTYDADGRRIKRTASGQETWQVYGFGGELLAEYQAGAAPMVATKEYGYRGGELLVTMSSGDDKRLKRFVTNLYYGALRRDPTPQELTDASNQLAASGAQGPSQLLGKAKQVARALFTQTAYETLSPARTDSQYVSDLYYTYLQRAADDSGLAWWVSQLASKGRSGVCDDFQNSVEFDVLVTTLYGNATSDNQRTEQFVNNFYLGAYGRFPTTPELQQQRDALDDAAAQGQTQAQSQAEAMGRALFTAQAADLSLPAQQFVTNLYEGFLQRGPDAQGLSFWTTQAGTTVAARQAVLNSFATSPTAKELAGALYREAFWTVSDHLGTPRMVVDKSGSLAGVKRHDYLPFGEELFAGVAGRWSGQGYDGDSLRTQFTGQERDRETGLDYFEARYFSPSLGRFTGTDTGPFTPADPQSLNRYLYVQNNPLKFVDPNGRQLVVTGDDADYFVEELGRMTGYSLVRNKTTGVVTIDPNSKRKTGKGISDKLADRLKRTIDLKDKGGKDVSVDIKTVNSSDKIFFDDFQTRTVDISDLNAFKNAGDGGAFEAGQLGHVLEEYSRAETDYKNLEKYGNGPGSAWYIPSHGRALEFESAVMSDFTGKPEAPRGGGEPRGNNPHAFFNYSSVRYDVLKKTDTGGKVINSVDKITRTVNP